MDMDSHMDGGDMGMIKIINFEKSILLSRYLFFSSPGKRAWPLTVEEE